MSNNEDDQQQKPGALDRLKEVLNGLKSNDDISAMAVLQSLTLVPEPFISATGAMGVFIVSVGQAIQQKKWLGELEQRLMLLDQTKLDQTVLESGELITLVIQALESISKSASDSKCHALANALLNSVTLPNSQVKGKEAILRLISQMSDEERAALGVLSRLQKSLLPNDERRLSGIPTDEIGGELKWEAQDTTAACEGLLQLGLILDSGTGEFGHYGNQHQIWKTTVLGYRVVRFGAEYAPNAS